MFDRFGEFDSCEELNEAAAGQKEEGDLAALMALAKENGIEKEDAEDYADGYTSELTTPLTAAMGRITVYREEYKKDINIRVAMNLLQGMITDPEIARAVMRKGKDPKKFMEILRNHAAKYQVNRCGTACATDRDKMAALRVFYTGSEEDLKKELEEQRARLLA